MLLEDNVENGGTTGSETGDKSNPNVSTSVALILDWQIDVRLEGYHISKSTTIQTPKVAQKLLCVLVEWEDLPALQQLASGYREVLLLTKLDKNTTV